MSGWEVGDLALARMNDGAWFDEGKHMTLGGPQPDGIYCVSDFNFEGGEMYLAFTEFEADDFFDARCFRKIKPDTEPCEEEFTVLIKRARKVDA